MELVLFGSLGIVLIVIGLAVKKIVSTWLIFIEPGHVGVKIDKQQNRVQLHPGYHLVKWPYEQILTHNWYYYCEENDAGEGKEQIMKVDKGYNICTQTQSMDLQPFDVYVLDQVCVEMNVLLCYQIVDPLTTADTSINLLSYMGDVVCEVAATIMSTQDYREINKKKTQYADEIRTILQQRFGVYGVRCTSFIIESMCLNENLQSTLEEQYIVANQNQLEQSKLSNQYLLEQARKENNHRAALLQVQAEMEMAEQQARREIALRQQETERQRLAAAAELDIFEQTQRTKLEKQRRQNEEEMAKLQYQNQQQQLRLEADLFHQQKTAEINELRRQEERKQLELQTHPECFRQDLQLTRYERLIEKGFTPEQIIQLDNGVAMTQAMAQSFGKTDKMIVSPDQYMNMNRYWYPYFPQPASST